MLNNNLSFNYRLIRSFTEYRCEVDADTVEKEISFHVAHGPSIARKGDVFPVYEIPAGKMIWLSDWSFNTGGPLDIATSIGGSLGRVTQDLQYSYVLNCAVSAGEMKIYSPARPVRYIAGEWLAVCFHHHGAPIDLNVRATFRFSEVPAPIVPFKTELYEWQAKDQQELFQGR